MYAWRESLYQRSPCRALSPPEPGTMCDGRCHSETPLSVTSTRTRTMTEDLSLPVSTRCVSNNFFVAQKDARKANHVLAGPGFVLTWPLFRCSLGCLACTSLWPALVTACVLSQAELAGCLSFALLCTRPRRRQRAG
jgi:hypothetical protein